MRDEWEKVALGEVATISAGGTPSRERKDFWNGNIPWIKTTFIQNNIISSVSLIDEYISESGLKNSSAKLFPKGTILLALIGQGKTRGQVALVEFEATTNQNAATIICSDSVNNHYLYQYLLSKYDELRCLSNSSGQGNLNLNLISSYKINLPPISVQVKIAAILSIWDSAIEKTEKLIFEKEKMFDCILEKFFAKKETSCFLKEIVIISKGKQLNKENMISNGTVPVLNGGISYSGFTNFPNTKKDTIAISEGGNSCGHVNFVSEDFWAGGHCYTLKVKANNVKSKFLYWMLKSKEKEIMKLRVGSGLPNIQQNDLSNLKIKIYNENDQSEIIEILDCQQKEISLLKKQLEQYKLQKQGLMQKLLTGEWRVK